MNIDFWHRPVTPGAFWLSSELMAGMLSYFAYCDNDA
jgi:hypothetical protein